MQKWKHFKFEFVRCRTEPICPDRENGFGGKSPPPQTSSAGAAEVMQEPVLTHQASPTPTL